MAGTVERPEWATNYERSVVADIPKWDLYVEKKKKKSVSLRSFSRSLSRSFSRSVPRKPPPPNAPAWPCPWGDPSFVSSTPVTPKAGTSEARDAARAPSPDVPRMLYYEKFRELVDPETRKFVRPTLTALQHQCCHPAYLQH